MTRGVRGCKKVGVSRTKTSAKLSQIRKAINRFLKKTEKIVKAVAQNARIVSTPVRRRGRPKRSAQKKEFSANDIVLTSPTQTALTLPKPQTQISIPQFREIRLSEIPNNDDDSSGEQTDDESYEQVHHIREKIESLLITRLEIHRVKSHGRSAVPAEFALSNLQQGLKTMEKVLSESTKLEYELEGVDLLPYAEVKAETESVVKFCGNDSLTRSALHRIRSAISNR